MARTLAGRFAAPAAVFVLALVPYAVTLRNGFVFDDRAAIVDNPSLHTVDSIPRLLVSPYWTGEGLSNRLYRPATMLSFALNHALLGGAAWGFHLVNILLHALVAATLCSLLSLLFGRGALAACAAALFAVHPLLSEAVAGVVGRAELLSALFVLAALRLDRTPGGPARRTAFALSTLCLLCALLSKENALAFPALVLLTDAVLGRPPGVTRGARIRELAVLLGAVAAYLALRGAVLGGLMEPGSIAEVDNPAAHLPERIRWATALGLVARYFGLFLFPLNLSADYSFPQIAPASGMTDPAALLGVGVTAGLILLAWVCRRRLPPLAWGIGFSGCAFFLVSNLPFPIGTLFAERLMYLPAAGLCTAAGCLAAATFAKHRQATLVGFGVLLALLAARTWERNRDWRDDFTLFRAAEKVSPRSAKVHYNLANAWRRRGDTARAVVHYRRCLDLFPAYDPARRNLAVALTDLGQGEEAVQLLRALLEKSPEKASLYNNLGNAYLALDRSGDAEAAYRKALSLDPSSADAHNNLAAVHQSRGEMALAEAELREAVRWSPNSLRLRVALGDLLLQRGDAGGAREAFRAALQQDPASAQALRGLGEALLVTGNRQDAGEALRRSLEADPAQWEAPALLGYLSQQEGEDEAAEAYYLRSLSRRPNQAELRQNLGVLYARQPGRREQALEQLRLCLALQPPEEIAAAVRKMVHDLERDRSPSR